MNGLLQKSAPKPKSNPMLDQIIQQAEAQVPENLKQQFLSIMTVGGKLMWSDEMTQERAEFDQALQQSGDVPTVVSHAVLKIISIIQNESKQEKPLDAVGIAAPIFMAHILQYVESKHGIPVTKEIIDQTGQLLQVNLLKMYGVTDAHIQELIKQRSQGGQPGQTSADQSTDAGPTTGGQAGPQEEPEEAPAPTESADDEEEE